MKILFKERLISKKREDGLVPGILYGPGIENISLEVNLKEFNVVFKEAGESSLITLESSSDSKKYLVLINEIQKDPITGEVIHIDFYQPNLTKKVEVSVPLVFIGTPPAVKELGGTLVKNFSEIEIRALPQKLIHSIDVMVDVLKNFEDVIMVKDLKISEDIEIIKDPEEIIALVTPVEDVEEEISKPIEENIDSVEKIEKKEKEKEEKEEVEG
jgi:large subunit ribosomal protein L25